MKLNTFNQKSFLNKCLIFILLLQTLLPVSNTLADNERVYGVPIQEFNELTNASIRFQTTVEMYDRHKNTAGFQLKMKQDANFYRYHIIDIYTKITGNADEEVNKHVKEYNKNIMPPLTADFDGIDAMFETSGKLTIRTTMQAVTQEIQNLMSEENDLNYIKTLGDIREELGYVRGLSSSPANDQSTKTDKEIDTYLKNNITNLRLVFTGLKDYLIKTQELGVGGYNYVDVRDLFIDTYDKVVKKAVEHDIEEILNMNLFSENNGNYFDLEAENMIDNLGVWLEEEGEFETLGPLILQGVAASATFRPFDTNMNNLNTFDFLGDEIKQFHSAFGTLRKPLFSPTDVHNEIKRGIEPKSLKSIKYMKLRNFISNPDDTKVLYIDNQLYDLSQLEVKQKAQSDSLTDEEKETNDEDVGQVEERTKTDDGGGFLNSANKFLKNLDEVMARNFLTEWMVLKTREELTNSVELIEEVVFASADMTDQSRLTGTVYNNLQKINESYLLINNIVEEYLDPATKRKLKADMDKPIYIDLYGNIVTASGIVVIPAISNPWYFSDDEPRYNLNTAFIESYPEIGVERGEVVVKRNDKKKKVYHYGPYDELGKKHTPNKYDEHYDADSGMFIPNVKFYVNSANKSKTSLPSLNTGGVRPIIKAFDTGDSYSDMYVGMLWSYYTPTGMSRDFSEMETLMEEISPQHRLLVLNNITVSIDEESIPLEDRTVSFKEVPDSDHIKRFLYLTNLHYITTLENGQIEDKEIFNKEVMHTIVKQVYFNGVRDLDLINTLVPEFFQDTYDKYIEFLTKLSKDRYDTVLREDVENNILYAKNIEEIKPLQGVLPIVYKVILLITLATIIINIVLTAIFSEGRMARVIKFFTIIYLITFLFSASSFITDIVINKPISFMYSKETAYWTLIEQERNTHKTRLETLENYERKIVDDTSTIKLFKIPFTYPYRMWSTNTDGSLTLEDYYEHYLNNDFRFRVQNTEMFIKGGYLAIDTKTLFDSSRIEIRDEEDPYERLEHQIYQSPEVAFYLPYYVFIDNITHNLNLMPEITTKMPHSVVYADGTVKTTGRVSNYINSTFFLDFDKFYNDFMEYEFQDDIDEELWKQKMDEFLAQYGVINDFLGINKILFNPYEEADEDKGVEVTTDEASGEDIIINSSIAPFTTEGIANLQKTGWYPSFSETMSKAEYDRIQRKIVKVNDRTKKFMMELGDIAGKVSDEHLIKTIALYASFQFNREFDSYTSNKNPTAIDLSSVPIERILLSVSMSKDDLVKSSITSYQSFIMENAGHFGMSLSSANDLLIVTINFIKPFIMVVIWLLAGVVIFFKKILIPDPKNRSIIGSLKLLAFYAIYSIVYAILVLIVIKLLGTHGWFIASQVILLIVNIAYIFALLYLVFAVIYDTVNLGSSVMFKGLEKMLTTMRVTVANTLRSVPLIDQFFGDQIDTKANSTHLEEYFRQNSLKYASNIGTADIRDPLNFSSKEFDNEVRNNRANVNTQNKQTKENEEEFYKQRKGFFNREEDNPKYTPVDYDSQYQQTQQYQQQQMQMMAQLNDETGFYEERQRNAKQVKETEKKTKTKTEKVYSTPLTAEKTISEKVKEDYLNNDKTKRK